MTRIIYTILLIALFLLSSCSKNYYRSVSRSGQEFKNDSAFIRNNFAYSVYTVAGECVYKTRIDSIKGDSLYVHNTLLSSKEVKSLNSKNSPEWIKRVDIVIDDSVQLVANKQQTTIVYSQIKAVKNYKYEQEAKAKNDNRTLFIIFAVVILFIGGYIGAIALIN
jgi:hypothetical protein